MKIKPLPSLEYLHECFDEKDGVLYWKIRPRHHFDNDRYHKALNKRCAGKVAGCPLDVGGGLHYFVVSINKLRYHRSRIVFALCAGHDPGDFLIDHKDSDHLNDRFDNLRLCTHLQNMANKKTPVNNKSGYKGVHYSKKERKYCAHIKVNSKAIRIGAFDDPESAYVAYCEAARKYFGEFARFE